MSDEKQTDMQKSIPSSKNVRRDTWRNRKFATRIFRIDTELLGDSAAVMLQTAQPPMNVPRGKPFSPYYRITGMQTTNVVVFR